MNIPQVKTSLGTLRIKIMSNEEAEQENENEKLVKQNDRRAVEGKNG